MTGQEGGPVLSRWFLGDLRKGEPYLRVHSMIEALAKDHGTDESLAEALLELAKQGDPDAQYVAGIAVQYGIGTDRSYEKGCEWCWKAIEQNHPLACLHMGELLELEPKSARKAIELYKRASESGLAEASKKIAWIYSGYPGLRSTDPKAIKWYLKAAEQGDREAQTDVGYKYEFGLGVDQSYEEASEWYLKAAEQGDGDAQNNLGYMYERGMAVDQSYEKAAEWYQKGVDNDNAFAMFYLGRLYETGRGVPRSARKA